MRLCGVLQSRGAKTLLLALAAFWSPLSRAFIEESGGGYTATTDVSETLNLALDIRDMRSAGSDFEQKKDIYINGRNTPRLSLEALSKTAGTRWRENPMFNLYKHAFKKLGEEQEHDTLGNFDGAPAAEYADRIVMDLFDLDIAHIEAEGALIFNVLMAFWGLLFDALETCRTFADHADPEKRMHTFLDEAVALWVGDSQLRGQSETGYMLYNLAQLTGERFNQDDAGTEVKVNRLVLESFVNIQTIISSNNCDGNDEGYFAMREELKTVVKYSNTVLVQQLLHRLEEDNPRKADFVEMYTLALVPQIAACDSEAYTTLLSNAVAESISDETKQVLITTLQSVYSCLHTDCRTVGSYEGNRIPQCNDAGKPALADYQPTTDVRKLSYIDRDIRHIEIFLEEGAFGAARDHYMYGWNSDTRLQFLAVDPFEEYLEEVVQFLQFAQDPSYRPDNIVMNALNNADPFPAATRTQRASVVTGVLQSTVMYWAVVENMGMALSECESGAPIQSNQFWDFAVAFFVGSMEGSTKEGKEDGRLLFALSKTFCKEFDTCEPGSSMVIKEMLASFKMGQTLLGNEQCQELSTLITDTMKRQLLVPLIQGTLFYANRASISVSSDAAGSLLAFSRAVLPAVNKVSAQSATTIDQNSNFFFAPSTTVNLEDVLTAFTVALAFMDVRCNDVGDLDLGSVTRGVCVDDGPVPSPTTGSRPVAQPSPATIPVDEPIHVPEPHKNGLAWGRYKFTNEAAAENDSRFSLDVKAMYRSTTTTTALTFYNQVISSNVPQGLYGNQGIQTLSDMSTKASTLMSQDPMYNYFRIALYDEDSFDDTANAKGWPYSDSIVQLALAPQNGNDAKLGSRAVVAMSVWMLIVNRLYESVRQCRSGKQSAELLDSAVGLWIGQEQGEGRFNSGWFIYSVAQSAAQLYGNEEKEAYVNTSLMTLFNKAQELMKGCQATDESAYLKYRFHVDKIVKSLSIPLAQNLLFYMSVNNFEYVELYALAFIPQTISCSEGSYDILRDALFEGFEREQTLTDDILDRLGDVFSCLNFSCKDLGDVTTADTYLRAMVDDLCIRLNSSQQNQKLAGYQFSSDVSNLDRLDLDIHQMDLFMRVGAYELAADVYEYGRNSMFDQDSANTIKKLAETMPALDTGNVFEVFRDYFDSPQYAQKNIIAALGIGQDGRFEGASRRQLSEVALRTSQAMISYMHVVGRLYAALNSCVAGNGGQAEVDEAVALYVGSMEGSKSGGDMTKNGKMMFALAKEVCETFDRCESHGDATANEFLMFAFDDMKQYFDDAQCEKARSVVEGSMLPMLQVPLIQGTLYFADKNSRLVAQATNGSLASGDIIAGSILPLVDAVNKTSSAVIYENMEFSLSNKPVHQGVAVVVRAFAPTLRIMGVDCNNVGRLGDLSTCDEDVATAPLPDTTNTNLGDDLYIPTTYVKDRANIALDVKDMEELLTAGTEDQAALVYEEGRNSVVYDTKGKRTGLRSLASFSSGASLDNPLATIAVYALADRNGQYLGRDAWLYADTIVKEALSKASQTKSALAAEAAVALNLWMELAKELHQTFRKCKAKEIVDEDGVHSIDEAAAYWIGDAQVDGDGENGHLLYALAEQMGEHFGLDETGQSRTNTNIIRLFHEAKIELSLPNACSESPTTAQRVRHTVNKITTQMVIVNVQALIHNLRIGDHERVRVYAHAFVPLVVSCNKGTFSFLSLELLESPFRAEQVEYILRAIYSTLPCFDIRCTDIGVHYTEDQASCKDPDNTDLAGYNPSTDVREFAQLDLDILEMEILLDMEAFEAAHDVYSFGKHVTASDDDGRKALSLQFLATSEGRSVVPEFDAFKRYFDDDDKYADSIIQSAFDKSTPYSEVQRRAVVIDTCRFMITYMAALQAMYEAISLCTTRRQGAAMKYWDIAAAFLTGYIEGSDKQTYQDGLLLWTLAKKQCAEFGTCSLEVQGSSVVNDEIATLLYAGRGAILGSNCGELRKTTGELSPLLLTPLIQASLSATTKLSQRNLAKKEEEKVQAEAYVYSLSVLPLIARISRGATNTISSNLNIEGKPVQDGVPAVARAFSSTMNQIGVDCEMVGVSTEIDACTGVVYGSSKPKAGLVVGIILLVTAVVALAYFTFRRRRKAKQKEQEKVEFVASENGELNHTSEVALEQRRTEADPDYMNGNDADAAMSDGDDDMYMDAVVGASSKDLV